MDIDKVRKFLNMREARLCEMEIATKLYIEIGNTLSPVTRSKFSDDMYADGCIYQFFAFVQAQTLLHFIFNNFITIIGNYDSKKNCLKSWENFELTQHKFDLLKQIRSRYSEIRNNLISHISTTFEVTQAHSVETKKIVEDIQQLKDILNDVRKLSNIPTLIKNYGPSNHPAVEGVQKLFEQLKLNHSKQQIVKELS